MAEFLRGFFRGVFCPWPKKKIPAKKPAKYVPPNSVRNIGPYTLSRGNANFATSITLSEKSNDSYKLLSYGDFSQGASSERQFFGFDP